MLNILYTIIIYPLVQIIEFTYKTVDKIFVDHGFAIIGVSLTVSFLCLPLYIIAEKWQNVERDSTRRLKPKIDKIKAVFSGDEQYMILSTFYRQNHYHPLYAMRNSFGILIQVPFFIAAYTFLSHLQFLGSSSFYFIRDLRAPDKLLTFGGVRFNILPLLMTAINCIAGTIYTKNLYIKDKIQIYGLAAVFLVLLYNSPAGLVLYWTMNNVFSLIKNIFILLKKPLQTLYIILCTAVLFLDVYLIFFHHGNLSKRSILIFTTFIIPLMPLLLKLYNWMYTVILKPLDTDIQKRTQLLVISLTVICLLTGFVIPSFVISSSPHEFSYIESVASPFSFLCNTFLQAFGFFVFWPICIFFLFGKTIKTLLVILAVCTGWGALVNTFCFSGDYGELSSMLTFSNAGIIRPSLGIALGNIAVMILLAVLVVFLIYINKIKIILTLSSIIAMALAGISAAHSVTINREFNRYTEISAVTNESVSLTPIFQLSREGKNVIVIMLDRAANGFVPEIFSESPELHEQFSGFVYYPNTLSFNNFTLIGAPPLFGGYEYTPEAINKRSEETLVKKHNEALLMMPVVFAANDFTVTVTDPPWANYSWIPDTRIYNKYPEIHVVSTIRPYTDIWLAKNNFSDLHLKSATLQRNFIWFSFFKSAPLLLRDAIYNVGEWWSTDVAAIDFRQLLNSYAVLDFLPLLTGTDAPKQNTFIILVNELTHESSFLQAPDYVPSPNITDYGNSQYADNAYYHTSAAALKRLGTWFDFLKQNDLYDNTRIIIAADHGANIETSFLPVSEKFPFNREEYNPLLMVKDFDANFPPQTVVSFMTNADVPSLAFKDLIQNPINPFTGNPVTDDRKQEPQRITTSTKRMPNEHNSSTFKISEYEWYTVHSDIFNEDNWQKLEK